jgi:hypothetical protein
MDEHTQPFCLRCGIHHTPDQRHRPVRAWFRRRKRDRR